MDSYFSPTIGVNVFNVHNLADGAYFRFADGSIRMGIGTAGLPGHCIERGGRVEVLEKLLMARSEEFTSIFVKNGYVLCQHFSTRSPADSPRELTALSHKPGHEVYFVQYG